MKISRKIIKNFMLNMEYQLPLTENYLTLILEVFDEDTIYDFLFRKCCKFTIEEFGRIMEFFEIKNIHSISYYIDSFFRNKTKKLEYFKKCIELYQNKIDYTDNIIFTKKNKNPHLGYYLLIMELEPELESLYYSVVKKYLDKSGSINIIIDDEEEKKKIEIRKLEIKNYFNLY